MIEPIRSWETSGTSGTPLRVVGVLVEGRLISSTYEYPNGKGKKDSEREDHVVVHPRRCRAQARIAPPPRSATIGSNADGRKYEAAFAALNPTATSGLGALLGFLEQDPDVSDVRWVAYMLATVKHECPDRWRPIEEFGKGKGRPYGQPVTVTDADGTQFTNKYYGRGYVQLTWKLNYDKMSEALGLGNGRDHSSAKNHGPGRMVKKLVLAAAQSQNSLLCAR